MGLINFLQHTTALGAQIITCHLEPSVQEQFQHKALLEMPYRSFAFFQEGSFCWCCLMPLNRSALSLTRALLPSCHTNLLCVSTCVMLCCQIKAKLHFERSPCVSVHWSYGPGGIVGLRLCSDEPVRLHLSKKTSLATQYFFP